MGNISWRRYTLERAFHRLAKPLFSWFALVTAQVRAIACASCQGLKWQVQLQWSSVFKSQRCRTWLVVWPKIIKSFQSLQKISSIHQFILEINLILETLDLKGHVHIWPCAPKVSFSFPDYMMYEHVKNQLNSFIHLRYSRL